MLAYDYQPAVSILKDKENFSDLILKSNLFDFISLSNNNHLKFHWSDSVETVEFIKRDIRIRGTKYEQFKLLLEDINEFSKQQVWIKTSKNIERLTLLDVYQYLLTPHKYPTLDSLNDFHGEISLISPSGPFKMMNLRTWLYQNDFLKVIYKNILTGATTLREFRLRTNGKVICRYLGSNSCILNVHQIGQSGILLYTEEFNFYSLIGKVSEITLQLDQETLDIFKNKNCNQIFNDLNNYKTTLFFTHKTNNDVSVKLSDVQSYVSMFYAENSKKLAHFLFIPYSSLNSNVNVQVIKDAVSEIKRELTKTLI